MNDAMKESRPIEDAKNGHWVNRAPISVRPYLQLSRLDRPVGYWLLALPGWIGLAFASLSHGLAMSDVKWAALILIGAIAMRGAGCTYNDIIDQDLDRQVERTALRPLPAGTVTTRQAWIWLFAQCGIGLLVLLCLPRLAQYMSLLSIPLVAAYPFMKRITWFPQLWLGMTFNWAVLVAYAAKTDAVSIALFILYTGLIFWTVGYDTIYACQDIEDDMKIGIKSTARKFGKRVKLGVGVSYGIFIALTWIAIMLEPTFILSFIEFIAEENIPYGLYSTLPSLFLGITLFYIIKKFDSLDSAKSLKLFKANIFAALILILSIYAWYIWAFHFAFDLINFNKTICNLTPS